MKRFHDRDRARIVCVWPLIFGKVRVQEVAGCGAMTMED